MITMTTYIKSAHAFLIFPLNPEFKIHLFFAKVFRAIPKCFNRTFVCYLCSLVVIGKGRVRFSSNILLFSCTVYCFWRLTLRNSAEQSGLPGVGDGESEEKEFGRIYYIASEIVILSAIFFTNGVIIMVIGKPIASVVKNMPNHISKKL